MNTEGKGGADQHFYRSKIGHFYFAPTKHVILDRYDAGFPSRSGAGWTSPLWVALIVLPVAASWAIWRCLHDRFRFEVSPNKLRIGGNLLCGRSLAVSDLHLEETRLFQAANTSATG